MRDKREDSQAAPRAQLRWSPDIHRGAHSDQRTPLAKLGNRDGGGGRPGDRQAEQDGGVTVQRRRWRGTVEMAHRAGAGGSGQQGAGDPQGGKLGGGRAGQSTGSARGHLWDFGGSSGDPREE